MSRKSTRCAQNIQMDILGMIATTSPFKLFRNSSSSRWLAVMLRLKRCTLYFMVFLHRLLCMLMNANCYAGVVRPGYPYLLNGCTWHNPGKVQKGPHHFSQVRLCGHELIPGFHLAFSCPSGQLSITENFSNNWTRSRISGARASSTLAFCMI